MKQNNFKNARENRFPRRMVLILVVILTGATVALAATAANWSGVSEARLTFAGGAPQPPLFQVKTEAGTHFFYITSRPVFKNTGIRSGAIRRVNIVPVGLKQPPRELKVLHLDKSEIAARETKEVRCEFVAVIDSAALDPQSRLEFRVHFYGPDDQEVYWEGITIENVDARSSLERRRSRDYVSIHSLAARARKSYPFLESL
jgi:hypothetical protein